MVTKGYAKKVPYKRDPVIVCVNLPWSADGKIGVRAGSRWPHLKDESEGRYLPFPFFLSNTTSLLKSRGFEAYIIDALAEGLTEVHFLQKLCLYRPDVVIIETSAPSFYNDIRI